jgi:hypothetical protein
MNPWARLLVLTFTGATRFLTGLGFREVIGISVTL